MNPAFRRGFLSFMDPITQQYLDYPYPEPIPDMIEAVKQGYHEFSSPTLFWPEIWPEGVTKQLNVLVAGCGTNSAVYNALVMPRARVVGIDVSIASLNIAQEHAKRLNLTNLELICMPIEKVKLLNRHFDYIVCTGVLHHLESPSVGLDSLRSVLSESGLMHLMVYGTHFRAGVYMLQEAFRILRLTQRRPDDIKLVREIISSIDQSHAAFSYIRNAMDLKSEAGIVDTFLNPRDISFTVPQIMEFLDRSDMSFIGWADRLEYCPFAVINEKHPILPKLMGLNAIDQASVVELLTQSRGTHRFLVGSKQGNPLRMDFSHSDWLTWIPHIRPFLSSIEADPKSNSYFYKRYWHEFAADQLTHSIIKRINGELSIASIIRQLGENEEDVRLRMMSLWSLGHVMVSRPGADFLV